MKSGDIKKELKLIGNPEKAEHSKRFFKTGKGEYGEGDKFFGCTVPEIRSVAKKFVVLPRNEVKKLLKDDIHECRMCALFILNGQFKKGDEDVHKEIVDIYLNHTAFVNNWDLVDSSAYDILGEWLKDKSDREILYKLAKSDILWEQRIAMVSTMAFIRNDDFEDTLKLAEIFMSHTHDLMHKACGWMLREVGKRNEKVLLDFLDKNHKNMPRTMLRYSIERLSDEQRKYYMKR